MKILVTGGCGFIGSHLVDALIDLKHDVYVIDDLSADNEKFYFNDKATYYKDSICNAEGLDRITQNCDFIFHMAAESRLQNSIDNPKRAVDVNIGGTFNILESCRKNKVKGLIFSSTSCVYGLTEELPIHENLKENCLNPYGSTKYAAELLIRNYSHLFNVKTCCLRYFNVFGERASSKGPYALVTGIFLRQKANGNPLTIVGDGSQKRDFIYVKDIVSANITCMENWDLTELTKGDVFNIGSGIAVSILELAKEISSNITFIPERLGEAKNNLCTNEKFSKLTNWKPSLNILNWIKTQKR
jgi:UDP-glucose 4-epimerase